MKRARVAGGIGVCEVLWWCSGADAQGLFTEAVRTNVDAGSYVIGSKGIEMKLQTADRDHVISTSFNSNSNSRPLRPISRHYRLSILRLEVLACVGNGSPNRANELDTSPSDMSSCFAVAGVCRSRQLAHNFVALSSAKRHIFIRQAFQEPDPAQESYPTRYCVTTSDLHALSTKQPEPHSSVALFLQAHLSSDCRKRIQPC